MLDRDETHAQLPGEQALGRQARPEGQLPAHQILPELAVELQIGALGRVGIDAVLHLVLKKSPYLAI